jgi:hypothetical protein
MALFALRIDLSYWNQNEVCNGDNAGAGAVPFGVWRCPARLPSFNPVGYATKMVPNTDSEI